MCEATDSTQPDERVPDDHAARQAPSRHRRRNLLIAAVVGSALLAAAGIAAVAALLPAPPRTVAAVDMNGEPVFADDVQFSTTEQIAAMDVAPIEGVHVTVPSVGLDVPLNELSVVGGAVVPPDFVSAFRIRDYGVPLAGAPTGSVFIAMHSIRGSGVAPGNYLFDTKTGRGTLTAGEEIRVGNLSYTVTATTRFSKVAVPRNHAVWANTPGRLVILTCLQNPHGGASTDNLVVEAVLNQPTPDQP